ncbi:MAG: glutamate-5-semialdehyde dehydrogenase [Thermoguttaceae bacterium]
MTSENNLAEYCRGVAVRARAAARAMAGVTGEQKNEMLRVAAELIRKRTKNILAENKRDIDAAPTFGLQPAEIDRLVLNEKRLDEITTALAEVAAFPDPIGEVISSTIRPNGLEVQKVRVPLGTVFFIYESRPNVTPDAAAICIKSGNAVILRGGKEAFHSNVAFADILIEAASCAGLPSGIVELVRTTDREAVGNFLKMNDLIDLTIPRGGEGLIHRVAAEATMPVIKHFAGNCHVYIDRAADADIAERVTVNAKCQRMGVCNAAESLVVHADVLHTIFPRVAAALLSRGIELRGDQRACDVVREIVAATDADFKTEFHGPIMSVSVVDSLEEAIMHINKFSDGHTEAIITQDLTAARRFAAAIDSSAVIINASTRFNDGGQFGLGAEIGISTDKFHARGPCGVLELTSYKYVVYGDGQVRE